MYCLLLFIAAAVAAVVVVFSFVDYSYYFVDIAFMVHIIERYTTILSQFFFFVPFH